MRAHLANLGYDPDKYIPMVDGGVKLHKTRAVIHDTCNAANAEEGEDEGMWVAACVELGEDGETPAGSKTPLGVVMQKCIVYYDFSEMDADIGRFESS